MTKPSGFGRGGGKNRRFGSSKQISKLPNDSGAINELAITYSEFRGGFDSRRLRDNTPANSSLDCLDIDVNKKGRLVRLPGTSLQETLVHSARQMVMHPSLNGWAELVLFSAPYLGIRANTVTQWTDIGLKVSGDPVRYALYGDQLIFYDGSISPWIRQAGGTAERAPTIPVANAYTTFAGRLFAGGIAVDGVYQPMGMGWSSTSGDPKDFEGDGANVELLVDDPQAGDRVVALRTMGLGLMAILCRHSIWIARFTGLVDRPGDFEPRVTGAGIRDEATAKTTPRGLIYLSDDGVRIFDGNNSFVISDRINGEILPLSSDSYSASFDPTRNRYSLHTPSETWIYDLNEDRWIRSSLIASAGLLFSTQVAGITWDQLAGDWSSYDGVTWQDLERRELDDAEMYYLRNLRLEKTDPASTAFFNIGLNPTWYTPQTRGFSLSNLVETKGILVEYVGSGTIELSLPNINSDYQIARPLIVLPAVTKPSEFWIPIVHTGLTTGVGLRIIGGNLEIIQMQLLTQTVSPKVHGIERTVPENRPVIQSDAILKPKIIWMDGFGGGFIQHIGYATPLADIENPISTPLTPDPGRLGWVEYPMVFGRYFWSLTWYIAPVTPEVAASEAIGGYGRQFPLDQWEWFPTGGRGGRGFLRSKADAPNSPGHFAAVRFLSDNPIVTGKKAGGCLIGLRLNGITPPEGDLNIGSFVAQFYANNTVLALYNYIVDIISHVVVGITPDRYVVIKRFDLTSSPNVSDPEDPIPGAVGTWVELGRSIEQVPANDFFSIEAGMYLSERHNFTEQRNVPNGLVYARLYLGDSVVGKTIIMKPAVVTRGWTDSLEGVAFGTDVRGLSGDGSGEYFSRGYPGIDFDTFIVFEHLGTVKRHLYDTKVGTSFPVSVTLGQSLPENGTRLGNVSRVLNTPADLASWNRYTDAQKDIFSIEPARQQAYEILGISAFKYDFNLSTGLPGHGGLGIILNGAETKLHQPIVYAINNANNALVLERDPLTNEKILPTQIGSAQLSWANEKESPTNGDSGLLQLGLEYAYREKEVIEEEHPPYPPIAYFAILPTGDGFSIFVRSTSVDWDDQIVLTKWNWGDGTSLESAGHDQDIKSHSYTTPGLKTVTLTVTDQTGLSNSTTRQYFVANRLPTANFSFAGVDLGPIAFTDLSTDPDGTIVAWLWNFGDGGSSTLKNPSHTFAAPGTYPVSLTVTDSAGGVASASVNIAIPIVEVTGCGFETDPVGDEPWVMGDDFAGGNPPFPAYIDDAAFRSYFQGDIYREWYGNVYSDDPTGVEFELDSAVIRNGHKCLRMSFGKNPLPPSSLRAVGAGWGGDFTDDDPTEEHYYITPPYGTFGLAGRVRAFWEAGVMSDPTILSTDLFEGLELFTYSGRAVYFGVYVRAGHLYLDVQTNATDGGSPTATSFDLGLETDFFADRGDESAGEIGMHYQADNVAHSINIKIWLGDMCSLQGTEPSFEVTRPAYPQGGTGGSGFSHDHLLALDGQSYFNWLFWPDADPNKNLWVVDAKIARLEDNPDPFGYLATGGPSRTHFSLDHFPSAHFADSNFT